MVKLTIRVFRARGLKKVVAFGSQHPAVDIQVAGIKRKGRACKSGGSTPVWDQTFVFENISRDYMEKNQLWLTIRHTGMMSTKPIGMVTVSLSSFLNGVPKRSWFPVKTNNKEYGGIELEVHAAVAGGAHPAPTHAMSGAYPTTSAAAGAVAAYPPAASAAYPAAAPAAAYPPATSALPSYPVAGTAPAAYPARPAYPAAAAAAPPAATNVYAPATAAAAYPAAAPTYPAAAPTYPAAAPAYTAAAPAYTATAPAYAATAPAYAATAPAYAATAPAYTATSAGYPVPASAGYPQPAAAYPSEVPPANVYAPAPATPARAPAADPYASYGGGFTAVSPGYDNKPLLR